MSEPELDLLLDAPPELLADPLDEQPDELRPTTKRHRKAPQIETFGDPALRSAQIDAIEEFDRMTDGLHDDEKAQVWAACLKSRRSPAVVKQGRRLLLLDNGIVERVLFAPDDPYDDATGHCLYLRHGCEREDHPCLGQAPGGKGDLVMCGLIDPLTRYMRAVASLAKRVFENPRRQPSRDTSLMYCPHIAERGVFEIELGGILVQQYSIAEL